MSALNETITVEAPPGDELGGKVELTWWDRGGLQIKLVDVEGRVKVTHFDIEQPRGLDLTVERDW